MPDILFWPAGPGDYEVCAELCILVLGRELDRLFGGLKRGLSTLDVMKALCRAENTEFSRRNFTLVEQDGHVLAGLCAFPADAHPQMMKRLPVCLQKDCGIGAGGLARLFLRSLRVNFVHRNQQSAPRSLYILLGGVFPAYQRTGVARSTLEHLFDRARAEGFQQVSLHVDRNNHAAMELYRSLQFHEAPGGASARRVLMTRPLD